MTFRFMSYKGRTTRLSVRTFIFNLICCSTLSACSVFGPSNKTEPLAACDRDEYRAFLHSGSYSLSLKHNGESERLIVVLDWQEAGLSLVGLNPLGAKRFHASWVGKRFKLNASALVPEAHYSELLQHILIAQAASNGALACDFNTSERKPSYTKLQRTKAGISFKIPHLGYNVALSNLQ